MHSTSEQFLSLLKIAMHGSRGHAFDIMSVRWEELMDLAERQGLSAVVYDGLQRLYDEHPEWKNKVAYSSISNRLVNWYSIVLTMEHTYRLYVENLARLCRFYQRNGLRVMVLKGYGLSLDYPVPEHRPCGDIDIYLFGKWREGDACVCKAIGNQSIEQAEHHTIFYYGYIPVENHYDFINVKKHSDAAAIETRLKELSKDARRVELNGIEIWLPGANMNVLYLLRHMAEHFACKGCTLRHLLDWATFCQAHSAEIDWEECQNFVKRIGLDRFMHAINALCVCRLGVEASVFPPMVRDEVLESRILEDLLAASVNNRPSYKSVFGACVGKIKEFWSTRWKRRLVYNESLLTMFILGCIANLRHFKSIKE